MDIQHYLRPVMQEATMARVATACAYLLILLLAYNIAELTWRILTPTPDRESAPAVIKEAIPITLQTKPDSFARTIAGLNLFGHADTTKSQTPTPVVRETQLNLVLRGVVATQGKSARAIIYSPSGSERGENPYAIDAKLPGGATLKEIHNDHIVLLHNGRHETLRLPKKVVSTSATGHKISSRSNRSSSPPSRASKTQKIREYRDALVNDPVSLIGIIRSAPYREDGKLVGYRVQTGRDKEALNSLGLFPGDIVTSVNGVSMSNSTQLMKLLKQLSKAEEVSAEVLRDGSPTTVTIRLDN